MTTARTDAFQLLKARDEVRVTDVAAILDYLEAVAGTSNAAARANALAIRDRHQLSESDLGRFYDYVNLLGTTLALTKTEFLHRRMRDRDFTSRRHIDYLYDLIDSAFGGSYASAVLSDMAITGGSFFEMQAEESPLTDTGPDGITDMITGSTMAELAGPFTLAPGNIALEESPTIWTTSYNSVLMDILTGASESSSLSFWVRPESTVNQVIIEQSGTQSTVVEVLSGEFLFRGNHIALADPGTWLANTAYAQGDRRRPSVDDSHVYECEVAGTSAVVSAGTQAVDFGGAVTGGTATGLANDGTLYDATVVVDGGSDTILVTGSAVQTFTTLITQLDLDTTGGTWSIIGGDLVCTSATTGETSTILISDGPLVNNLLFDSMTGFASILAAVDGDGEPTFPSSQGVVVDGTVTWRHVSHRSVFHDLSGTGGGTNGQIKGPAAAMAINTWYHVAVVKDTTGVHIYLDGVLADEVLIAAPNTIPGSFGTPVRLQYDQANWKGTGSALVGTGGGGSIGLRGRLTYVAFFDGALTGAQIAQHYATAVEQGLA